MAKLLVVDDDPEIRKMCKMWFEPLHTVETIDGVKEAIVQIREGFYDLIILDLSLPDGDGREVLQSVRTRGGATPILVLTGRSDINSKVNMLDLGADDYLTKPFHFKELEARVRTILRRPADLRPDVLTAGAITLNLANARLTKGDQEIVLTPREFSLLELFMRHPNQAFSQDAIMQRVWANDSEVSPDIVRVYITKLRKKLESPGDPPLIQNQRGHGYIFSPPLTSN